MANSALAAMSPVSPSRFVIAASPAITRTTSVARLTAGREPETRKTSQTVPIWANMTIARSLSPVAEQAST